MSDINIDDIIGAITDDKVGKNADSILGMLQEGNKLLAELDKAMVFLKKLEGSILVSAVVKMKAKEKGIELTPLSQDGIIPSSETHRSILESINKMNPEQLKELVTAITEHDRRKEKPSTRKSEN